MPDEQRSELQRMLAGEAYRSTDPELLAAHGRAARLSDAFNHAPPDARRAILVELLGTLGEGAVIRPPLHIDYGFGLHVGAGAFVNFGLVALDVARIEIGAGAQIGPGVQLLTATHPTDPEARREGWEGSQPICIGANAWLGGGVVVCPGVRIGADSTVGAGSVVVADIPERVVAAGNPARVLRAA